MGTSLLVATPLGTVPRRHTCEVDVGPGAGRRDLERAVTGHVLATPS